MPKTAGTSLRLSLERWFSAGRLLLHYQDTETLALPKQHTLRGGVCIHGHFEAARGYGVDTYYPDAQQFIVFLRDPFERAISLYSFIRKHQAMAGGASGWRERVLRRKSITDDFMPFDQWIPFLLAEQAAGRSNSYPWFFPGAPNVETVKRLMHEKFVFVGIMEDYDRSLDALARVLGKKRLAPRFVNRTPRPNQDFACWRKAHVAAFPEEYEIYETALKLNRAILSI